MDFPTGSRIGPAEVVGGTGYRHKLSSAVALARSHPAFLMIFLAVLAPIGAVVVVTVLLLFGVTPATVFAPGRALKSLLESGGHHVANRVAVAGTVAFWWLLIAGAGLLWEWGRGRRSAA